MPRPGTLQAIDNMAQHVGTTFPYIDRPEACGVHLNALQMMMRLEGETIMSQVFKFAYPHMLTAAGKGHDAMGNVRLLKRQRTKLQDVVVRLPDDLAPPKKAPNLDPP